MQDLKKHELFELEVLDRLNSGRLLSRIVFAGGTMLRLCYGLDRYSSDLDFWIIKETNFSEMLKKIKKYLGKYYSITDAANKRYSLLLELKAAAYPRRLKIEIRKEIKNIKTVASIAYSKDANIQVLVKTVSLTDMMNTKIKAFLDRKEIRDVYDMEFLLKSGVELSAPPDILKSLVKGIEALSRNDYKVKLSSLLEPAKRKYFQERNFAILLMYIKRKLQNY